MLFVSVIPNCIMLNTVWARDQIFHQNFIVFLSQTLIPISTAKKVHNLFGQICSDFVLSCPTVRNWRTLSSILPNGRSFRWHSNAECKCWICGFYGRHEKCKNWRKSNFNAEFGRRGILYIKWRTRSCVLYHYTYNGRRKLAKCTGSCSQAGNNRRQWRSVQSSNAQFRFQARV